MSTKRIETCFIKNIKRFYYPLLIIVILIFASYIRFYKLAQVPAGMTWDEAAIGYNGFSIWKVRRDEWLHFLPISSTHRIRVMRKTGGGAIIGPPMLLKIERILGNVKGEK